jgi:GTPase SAR1 family protein
MATVSVACIGANASGKTCLLDTFVNDEYPTMTYLMDKERYDCEKKLTVDGQEITIKI